MKTMTKMVVAMVAVAVAATETKQPRASPHEPEQDLPPFRLVERPLGRADLKRSICDDLCVCVRVCVCVYCVCVCIMCVRKYRMYRMYRVCVCVCVCVYVCVPCVRFPCECVLVNSAFAFNTWIVTDDDASLFAQLTAHHAPWCLS
jgi:hypothetical protein